MTNITREAVELHKLTPIQAKAWKRLYSQGVRCVRAKTVTIGEDPTP